MRYPRARIVKAARSLIGTRFVHRGRNPEHGLDCVGLVLLVGRMVGARVPDDVPPYGVNGSLRFADTMLREWCQPLDYSLDPGNIFLAAVDGMPRHLGLVARIGQRTTIVHASITAGAVVEHGIGDLVLLGTYRYRFGD